MVAWIDERSSAQDTLIGLGGGGEAANVRLRRNLHFSRVVRHQLLGDPARREFPRRDLRHRGHFRRGAGNDVLGEAIEFIRHDAAFDHLDAAAPREFDRGGTSDAGETLLFIRTAD